MYHKVVFMSQADATQKTIVGAAVMVSIQSPGMAPLKFMQPALQNKVLSLCFDPVQFASEGKAFSEEQANLIACFLKEHQTDEKATIFVHCKYGEQRSKSCAMGIAYGLDLPLFDYKSGRVDLEHAQAPVSRIFDLTYEAISNVFE